MYRIFKRQAPEPPSLDEAIADFDPLGADFAAIVRQAAFDGKPFEFESRIRRGDGTWCAVRAKGRGQRHADGRVIGIVGVLQDISARKDAERERKISMTFQRAVLPAALPQVSGCTFDAVYEPGFGESDVGGDWYDALTLPDGRIFVSIGDVAGGGLEAAVIVGVARQVMRGIAQLHPNPTLMLDAADRALSLEYPNAVVSTWVGLIDLVTRTISYASAGHPPPIVVSRDGRVRELDDPQTLLIGLREGHRGYTNVVRIEPGDTLVLYTDGVTEAGRDVIAGTRALHEAAATLAAAEAHPADAIRRRVIPDGSVDDVAILVVRTDCAGVAERAIDRWSLDVRDPAAARAVRAAFVVALEHNGHTGEECAHAETIFGELVANVVQHGGDATQIEIALDHGGKHSVLHFLDRGQGFSEAGRLPVNLYAESGRGLFVIRTLAADFTLSDRPGGGSHARVVLRARAACGAAANAAASAQLNPANSR